MVRKVLAWTAGGILTLLYAIVVVAAVGNVIMLPQMGATLGFGITPVGWWWLGFGIGLPVIVYAAALVIARRSTAGLRLLALLTGLALVAAVQLEVMHFVPESSFFA